MAKKKAKSNIVEAKCSKCGRVFAIDVDPTIEGGDKWAQKYVNDTLKNHISNCKGEMKV